MSPRLPRDVSGQDLVKRLEAFGYVVTRQKGSHLRLTTPEGGEHHVTVPNHDALRAGTLNGILMDIAEHAGLTRDAVVERLLAEDYCVLLMSRATDALRLASLRS